MVLDFLKGLFGGKDLTAYEREVLERQHSRLSSKISDLEAKLAKVPAAKSKKQQNPQAVKLMSQIKKLKKERQGIEKDLGGAPDSTSASVSRRS